MHECLFCTQTFATATAKDDHVLEHFAQETCTECNRHLVRIGCSLYVKHEASICSIRAPKRETSVEKPTNESQALSGDDGQCVLNITTTDISEDPLMDIKQTATTNNSNGSIDFDLLDGLDGQSVTSDSSESDGQSMASDIESKLQEMLCKEEIQIDADDTEQHDERVEEENDEGHAADTTASKFECDICGKKFRRKQGVSKHILLYHRKIKKSHPDLK